MTEPAAPRTPTVHLRDLVTTDLTELVGDEARDGERYVGADLTGRDLRFAAFTECAFDGVRLSEADLSGAQFGRCRLTEADAALLRAPRSVWRQTTVAGSRIGAAELYETEWRSVVVTDTKIGFLNARSARWSDVRLQDCIVDELDLGGATVTRLALAGSRIRTLRLGGATLTDVDLRGADLDVVEGLDGIAGATVSDDQLALLGPALARHLGLRVDRP